MRKVNLSPIGSSRENRVAAWASSPATPNARQAAAKTIRFILFTEYIIAGNQGHLSCHPKGRQDKTRESRANIEPAESKSHVADRPLIAQNAQNLCCGSN